MGWCFNEEPSKWTNEKIEALIQSDPTRFGELRSLYLGGPIREGDPNAELLRCWDNNHRDHMACLFGLEKGHEYSGVIMWVKENGNVTASLGCDDVLFEFDLVTCVDRLAECVGHFEQSEADGVRRLVAGLQALLDKHPIEIE